MNIDNRQRSRTGLIMAALIFIAIGVGVVLSAQRLIADASWVTHTNEVIARIDEIEARLRDTEAAQRGFLLTLNPTFLADYRNARAKLPALKANLIQLVQDNPAQQARARALGVRIDQRTTQLANTLERYRLQGLPAAQQSIDQNVIESSSAIREQAESMRVAESILLGARGNSTRISANLLRAIALLGIPIGILVIFAVYRLLVLEIRRRANAEGETAQANEQLQVTLERVQLRSIELRALSNYGSMLQSCAQPEEAWQLTESLLARLLPDAAGSLYRIRNSQDHAELAAQWGETAQVSPEMIAVDACWALRRGQPHASDATHGARCRHLGAEVVVDSTVLCVPLVAQGAQLGLLSLSGREQSLSAHRDIIEAAVEKLSMALANLSLQDRLRQQSIRDPLSGLFNRRYLEESATRELARCARRGLPLSLMMLDIDHFKAFNDMHGHGGGDAVLVQLGKLLKTMTRGEDIACRYGGEEFTLILPEADRDGASERAEAIRNAVEAMPVPYWASCYRRSRCRSGWPAIPSTARLRRPCCRQPTKRCTRPSVQVATGLKSPTACEEQLPETPCARCHTQPVLAGVTRLQHRKRSAQSLRFAAGRLAGAVAVVP